MTKVNAKIGFFIVFVSNSHNPRYVQRLNLHAHDRAMHAGQGRVLQVFGSDASKSRSKIE